MSHSSSREVAHRTMLRRAELDFLRYGRLPDLSVVENPSTRECRVIAGRLSGEDGMAKAIARVRSSRNADR